MAAAFTPYGYQETCLGRLRLARRQGAKRALIVMASGLGKTVTAAFDAKRFAGGLKRLARKLGRTSSIADALEACDRGELAHPTTYYS